MRRVSVEREFHGGRFDGVLARPMGRAPARKLGHVVGALCLTGRVEEAESVFHAREARLPRGIRIQCRFYLLVGWMRVSRYELARRYLRANLRETAGSRGAGSRVHESFYAFQGLGFYWYYCGRWRAASRAAERAFDAAVRGGYAFGKLLASDLRGHLLVQTEGVEAGLRLLADARAIAIKLENAAMAEAVEFSILGYEAQYGVDPGRILERLRRKVRSTAIQDTYSRSSLLLELARQHRLRGALGEAKGILDEASRLIYRHRNRRQEALLNLRYADLSLQSGDPYRALSLVQSARRALDPRVDRVIELSVLGFELKLVRRLGLDEARERELLREIRVKSSGFGGSIHRRILHREHPAEFPAEPEPQGDRIAQLLERVRRDPAGAPALLSQSGYYGWIGAYLGIEPGDRALFFGARLSLIVDGGDTERLRELTPRLGAVLRRLARGEASKESLIETVWGYRYHPLRHDPLIYAVILDLRKRLGRRGHWLETTESGYRLFPGIQVIFESRKEAPPRSAELPPIEILPDLNHRQLSFLSQFPRGRFTCAEEYRKAYGGSEATARRDLAELHRRGMVRRVGRARATRYVLGSAAHSSLA